MTHVRRLWPLAACLVAVALAVAAYRQLHDATAPDRPLRRSLALLARPGSRAAAEAALRAAVHSGPSPLRAQAANVLASVLVREHGSKEIPAAIRLYREAIRLDPTDASSKFDLELLLTLTGRRRGGASSRPRHGGRTKPAQSGAPGSGGQSGGTGY